MNDVPKWRRGTRAQAAAPGHKEGRLSLSVKPLTTMAAVTPMMRKALLQSTAALHWYSAKLKPSMDLRTLSGSALSPSDQLSRKGNVISAEAIWILAERLSGEHIAQLYSSETVLVESLRMFTAHGLSRGETVVLVLTPSHRTLLEQHPDGFDVDALQRDGQLLLLDAAELLTSFMRDGMPDAALLRMSIAEIVEGIRRKDGNRKIRVFGEMVDLLWEFNLPAAVRLEQMWNELIELHQLSLFCAYSTSHVARGLPDVLRAPHSHIISLSAAESSPDAIVGH